MKFLLDTNPIIEALNSKLKLTIADYIISFISELELLSFHKLDKNEEKIIKLLLSNFTIIDISPEIKSKTIQLRRKYKLKLPDSIIVATAIVEKAILVTADKQLLKIEEISTMDLKELTYQAGGK